MRHQTKERVLVLWNKTSLLSVLFILITTVFCFSQKTGSIFGSIISAQNNVPVEFCTVTVLNNSDSTLVKATLSDLSGLFTIEDLQKGDYILRITSIEFKTHTEKFNIGIDLESLNIGEIKLQDESNLLNEVVISAEKLAFKSSVEGITVNPANSLFKTCTSVSDVLSRAPSIQVRADGSILMKNGITPKVLINGRDVPMNKEELNAFLTTLRPEEVESIEIVTNPSSKYDAEYKGVIVIKLKKNEMQGFRGGLNLSFSRNQLSSQNVGVNLNFKTPKTAYRLRTGVASNGSFENSNSVQSLLNQQRLNTDLEMTNRNKFTELMFGIDHDITKNHAIGGQVRVFNNDQNNPFRFTIDLLSLENATTERIISKSDISTINNNISLNGYYEGKFDWASIVLSSSYAQYDNSQSQLISNSTQSVQNHLKGDFGSGTNIFSTQLDISPKIKKGKIETGVKYARTEINNFSDYNILVDDVWLKEEINSNSFLFNERNLATYLSYAGKFKHIEYLIGGRVENTQTIGNSLTLQNITRRNYTKFLPSANLNWTINDNNNLNVSLAKKITRPQFSALNPYIFIGGPYASFRGNQFLIPIDNNSLSIAYFFRRMSLTTNLGVNYNDIQQVPFYNPETNETIYIYENLSSNKYKGVELSVPLKTAKIWTSQISVKHYQNDYNLKYDLSYFKGNVTTKIQYSSLSFFNNFGFQSGYNFSVNGHIETGGGTALFNLKPKGFLNLSAQKTYFKTLNINLTVNDLFYTYIVRAESLRPDIINLSNTNRYGSRFFAIQLSYSFGQSKYSNKNIKSSSQEEENRAIR